MGKPQAPKPPDYAAAATAQGQANENAALGSNYLNQVNQQGPYGSLTYNYDKSNGMTLPDGTVIPSVTATTMLSPDQQTLLDQQTGISKQLNTLAGQGIGYVGQAVNAPYGAGQFNPLTSSVDPNNGTAVRDQITNAYMARLAPQINQDRSALENKLANQGIQQGTEAYNNATRQFDSGVADQRTSALLAGDQEQQSQFNRGLASGQFANQAQQQAIQEADYFRNQPLNMLNALRTGNSVNLPQFGNVSGGAQFAAAPVYQATSDQYGAAMQKYNAQMNTYNSIMGGIAGMGGAAMHLIPGYA